jgi:hypothetical protein
MKMQPAQLPSGEKQEQVLIKANNS